MASQAAFRPMNEALRVPVQDLVSQREPVTLSSSATLKAALVRLGDTGLLSAPVVDSDNFVHGFVDYLDIAAHLVSSSKGDFANLTPDLLDHPLQRIVGASQRNPYIHLLGNNPATLAVEFFSTGIHRCAVFNTESRLTAVLSQSDLIRYMNGRLKAAPLQTFAGATVEAVGWGHRHVISITSNERTFDAVALMMEHRISSLAVVDEQAQLIGNFSLSDLRGVTHDIIAHMALPVVEFLGLKSPASLKPRCTTMKATIGDTIAAMATLRLHRLWIVNKDNQPTGVITQTDVMNALFMFKPRPEAFALSIPGTLAVTVLGAKNLNSGWRAKPYVVAHIPERGNLRGSQFITPVSDNPKTPQWKQQSFEVNVDEGNARDRLLFLVKTQRVFGADDLLGYVTVSMDWVLSGFGCGKAVTSLTDYFELRSRSPTDSSQGELELCFVYTARPNATG